MSFDLDSKSILINISNTNVNNAHDLKNNKIETEPYLGQVESANATHQIRQNTRVIDGPWPKEEGVRFRKSNALIFQRSPLLH